MSGFIRELYYGNIDAQAHGIRKGSQLHKASELLSKNEALLYDYYTDAIWSKYTDKLSFVSSTPYSMIFSANFSNAVVIGISSVAAI